MKIIKVKNLQIQFDDYDAGADQHNAHDMLDKINEVLQERFPDASPKIFTNAIDSDDIEISLSDDSRVEMIDEIIGAMGDRPENDDTNREWLEGLNDEELEERHDAWVTS